MTNKECHNDIIEWIVERIKQENEKELKALRKLIDITRARENPNWK